MVSKENQIIYQGISPVIHPSQIGALRNATHVNISLYNIICIVIYILNNFQLKQQYSPNSSAKLISR